MENIRESIIRHMAADEGRHRTGALSDAVDHRIRVAAYCQVERGDDQQTSIELQDRHYQAKIAECSDWAYTGIYADAGAFGRDEERPAFQRMMQDAEDDSFDMLITPSIGRFVCSTDELETVFQRLKELDIPVYFELQGFTSAQRNEQELRTEVEMEENVMAHLSEYWIDRVRMR